MNKTKIEWCDYTWNPLTGCLHGCDYCYARKIAKRFEGTKAFPNGFEPTFHEERLNEPLKLIKPSKIFVVSMGDLFGDWIDHNWIENIITICKKAPQHTFMFLTKNPCQMQCFNFPINCWCGFSASTQRMYDFKLNELLKVNCKIKFASIEPIHEHINPREGIDWLIVGAETKNGKTVKPPHNLWMREIIAYSHIRKVKLFLKTNLNWKEKIQEFPERT